MKNVVYLMMPLLFMIGCSHDDGSGYRDERPPLLRHFTFYSTGESSDIYKVSIQTLDKIKPKPTFYDANGYVIRKEGIAQGAYEATMATDPNVNRTLRFNPMYVDKERLLEIKIYKKNRLLTATTVGYTLRAIDGLYELGEGFKGNAKKGDVLSLNQVTWFTHPKLRIVDGGKGSKFDFGHIHIKAGVMGIHIFGGK